MDKYEITYLDGTVEVVSGDRANVYEGTLNIHVQTGGISYAQYRHVGSWPLVSIRKWRLVER